MLLAVVLITPTLQYTTFVYGVDMYMYFVMLASSVCTQLCVGTSCAFIVLATVPLFAQNNCMQPSIHVQYCHNLSQDIRLGVGLGKELGLGLGLGNRRSKALKPLLAILDISLLGTVLGSPI